MRNLHLLALSSLGLGLAITALPTAASAEHRCAVLSDGSVKCWGNNGNGQLGQGDTSNRGIYAPETYGALPGISLDGQATAISTGGDHACAVLDDGSVKCWGLNNYGQLGQGDTSYRGDHANEMGANLAPISLGAGAAAVDVTGGAQHTCATRADGSVKCWGRNDYGQLGLGHTTRTGDHANEMGDNLAHIDFGDGRSAVSVFSSAESDFSCAILNDGAVKCWGYNSNGQLGQGDTQNRGWRPPEMGGDLTAIDLDGDATQVSTGEHHVCALLDDGSVKCWGRNNYGQLGQSDTAQRGDHANEMGAALDGVDLGTNRTATDVATGAQHNCVLLDDNSIKCWGRNDYGQLGLGHTTRLGDHANEMGDNLGTVNLGTGYTAADVDANNQTACAILNNGDVKCWGYNANGQLGQGDTHNRGNIAPEMGGDLPDTVPDGSQAVAQADAGLFSMCARLADGSVRCWGRNNYGQLGYGDTTQRGDHAGEMSGLGNVDLGTGRTATDITSADYHACAVLDHGGIKCWGRNDYGQLGIGSTTRLGDHANEMGDNLPTINLGTGYTAADVVSNGNTSCAILNTGEVKCWGYNSNGQLGQGDTHNRGIIPPEMGGDLPDVEITPGLETTQLSGGDNYTCALLEDGTVKCWGRNNYGQLGYGDTTQRGDHAGEMSGLNPVDLGTGALASALGNGGQHSCALLNNGSIKCWGRNDYGQLGIGSTTRLGDHANEMGDNLPTINLGTGYTAAAIASGNQSNCAILNNGDVKCWGYNANGQLGQGDTHNRGNTPEEMGGQLTDIDVGTGLTLLKAAGGLHHTCGLTAGGEVKCWGRNSNGALGLGDTSHRGDHANEMGDALDPVDLGTGLTATDIATGNYHGCAVLNTGDVKCWGYNGLGQLGIGNTTNQGDHLNELGDNQPTVNLGTGYTATSIDAQEDTSCALLNDGSVKCWGSNSYGQLGQGDSINRGTISPEMGGELPDVALGTNLALTKAVAGQDHTCGLTEDGEIKCWGRNTHGVLGLGDTSHRGDHANEMGDALDPVDLGTGRTATDVATGGYHGCAILDTGDVKCWGYNGLGNLGIGNTTNQGDHLNELGDNLPAVNLGTGYTATSIDAKESTTCAILNTGDVKCWGSNSNGQLGQGDTLSRGTVTEEMGGKLPDVVLGTNVALTKAVAGQDHTCGLTEDGEIKCWGRNTHGVLGLGDTSHRGDHPNEMGDALDPVDLGTGRTATDVATGGYHGCAILDTGDVKCWGYNGLGNLGIGNTTNQGDHPNELGDNQPVVNLGTGYTATSIDAKESTTCAILNDGSVKCWGANDYGQLGQGDTLSRGTIASEMGGALPDVALGTNVALTKAVAGQDHTCGLTEDGEIKCWGRNTHGVLGLGDTSHRGDHANEMGDALDPVDLGTGRTATDVATGGYHGCAILDTGDVKCWGYNGLGNLGIGNTTNQGDHLNELGDNLPAVNLGTGYTATSIDAKESTTCAILNTGDVKCWGSNSNGQLGQGDAISRGTITPEMGGALSNIDLGPGLTVTKAVSGTGHTCAQLSDGVDTGIVKCWGRNSYGNLGLGDTAHRGDHANEMGAPLPAVDLGTGRSASDLISGAHHTCAVLDDDTLKCWGLNANGQLGQGDTTYRGDHANEMGDNLTTIDLGTQGTLASAAAGGSTSCALLSNGDVKCWGYNGYGNLGQDDTLDRGTIAPEMGRDLLDVDLNGAVTALATGQDFACALLQSGQVQCWGRNNYGQLGLGDTSHRGDHANEMGVALPTVDLGTGRSAQQIAAGDFHTCAILDDGTLKCWGLNNYGQLGQGDTTYRGDHANEMGDNLSAIDLGAGRSAVAVTVGASHTCALLDDDTVKCWGYNGYGNLGYGDTASRGDAANEMGDNLAAIDLGDGAQAISASTHHTCALLNSGAVKCWGRNNNGQLGVGNTTQYGDGANEMGANLPAVNLGTGLTAQQITTGLHYTCALLSDDNVKCWGRNNYGQLGVGHTSARGTSGGHMGDNLAYVDLGAGATVSDISATHDHTCATLTNGDVKCWGYNANGQLGVLSTDNRGDAANEMGDLLPAARVAPGLNLTSASAGGRFSCGITQAGAVKCWGYNGYGNLGYGDTTQRGDVTGGLGDDTPPILLGQAATQLSVGQHHTCALLDDGSAKCWGRNNYGQLGVGNTTQYGDSRGEMASLPTISVGTGRTVAEIGVGHHHTCALLDNGGVKCWGRNDFGQLGVSHSSARGSSSSHMGDNLAYVDLGTGRTATDIEVGNHHTCAVLDNGRTKCWGYNNNGQLGVLSTDNRGDAANEMGDLLPEVSLLYTQGVSQVTTGDLHSCAVFSGGQMQCWGYNGYGQLGQNDTTQRGDVTGGLGDDTPPILLGQAATQVSVGTYHACAVLADGSAKCWGYNGYGNLGVGNTTQYGDSRGEMAALPTINLGAGRTVTEIDLGHHHTCALLDNGGVKCWGRNDFGQLGVGHTSTRGSSNSHMGDNLAYVDLGTGRTAVDIEVGGHHACATLDNGRTKCWGRNSNGQLGVLSTDNRGDAANEMGDLLPEVNLLYTRNVIQSVSGINHSCAVFADGQIQCWGYNGYGQLGQNNTTQLGDVTGGMGDDTPPILLGQAATQVSVGTYHACAVLADGSAKCWGYNGYGNLGTGNTTQYGDSRGEMAALPTINLGAGLTVAEIGAGHHHTCALLNNGGVKCWGRNDFGQLGQGNTSTRGDSISEMGDNLAYVDLGTGRTAVDIEVGGHHACATLDNGRTKCWGRNNHGQLGVLSTDNRGDAANEMGDLLPEVNLLYTRNVIQSVSGINHSCAVFADGQIQCWGYNGYGQLGQEDTQARGDVTGGMGDDTPPILLGQAATQVSVGTYHACAVLADGSAKCWGYNGYGNLGTGNTTQYGDSRGEMAALPTINLGAGLTVSEIGAGVHHTCALLNNGGVKCWGRNDYGQLGVSHSSTRGSSSSHMGDNLAYVDLGTGRTATDIEVGGHHACATLDNGRTKCWGRNNHGQLGVLSTDNRGDAANEMGDLLPEVNLLYTRNVIQSVSGINHSCAVFDDGQIQCWGYNGYGQLGQSDTQTRGDVTGGMGDDTPPILLGQAATQVSVGNYHVCAVLADGSAKCWGYNGYGNLGVGNTTQYGDSRGEMAALPTINLGAGRTVSEIGTGIHHTCALLDNGGVKCWGRNNYGQLGQGNTSQRGDSISEMGDNLAYVDLGAGRTATDIEVGGHHACAVLDNGRTKCWGRNNTGQLGVLGTDNRGDAANEMGDLLPEVNLLYTRNVTHTITGTNHSCALFTDGQMQCWGYNGYGQLGTESTTQIGDVTGGMGDDTAPVILGQAATQVSVGDHHTCAVLADGSAKCWGYNGYGQLGQGNSTQYGDNPGEMASLTPISLGAGRTVTQIGAGQYHTCALLDNGRVKCFGYNNVGQLGYGYTSNRGTSHSHLGDNLAYVDLGNDANGDPLLATQISVVNDHSCARLSTGRVKCWGRNSNGQLGVLSTAHRGDNSNEMGDLLPEVSLLYDRPVAAVTAFGHQACALLADGAVQCWGYNGYGQLGYDDTQRRGDVTGGIGDDTPPIFLGTGRTATQVSVGALHACAVLDDQTLKCWGYNGYGQLGLGNTTQYGDNPGEMVSLNTVNLGTQGFPVQVGTGDNHSCARLNTGRIKCWGRNNYGQLGQGNTSQRGDSISEMGDNLAFTDLGTDGNGDPLTATHLDVGPNHACATLTTGRIKCWGRNNTGQLGVQATDSRGDSANEMGNLLPEVNLLTDRAAVSTLAGGNYTCAHLEDGALKCWGYNGYGNLGLENTVQRGDATGGMGDDTAPIILGQAATQVSVGDHHTCAVLADGSAKCWGYNGYGQLGQGNSTQYGDNPGEMANLSAINLGAGRTVTQIGAGQYHTCALLDNGRVKCFGYNNVGQLGYGYTSNRGTSSSHMGDNLAYVDLGNDALGDPLTALSIDVDYDHTCAQLANDTVRCWGRNSNGQLGALDTAHRGDNSNEMGDNLRPTQIPAGVAALSMGGSSSCALYADGAVRCWGYNGYGNLGQGDTNTRGNDAGGLGDELQPIRLGTGRTATQVALGWGHACALLDDGGVKCWGYNGYGQLGTGNTTQYGDAYVEMGDNLAYVNLGGVAAVDISANYNSTCALLSNGDTKCWGRSNVGQLGQGSTSTRGDSSSELGNNLATTDLGSGVVTGSLYGGYQHSCALFADGTARCWGRNSYGQLGIMTTDHRGDAANEMGDRLPLARVDRTRAMTEMALGTHFSCGLLADGTVKCWGQNNYGQLGYGDTLTRAELRGGFGEDTDILDLGTGRTAQTVTQGRYHSCAILDDDTLKCWGYNGYGQLGQGNSTQMGDHYGEMGDDLPAINLGTDEAGDTHTVAAVTGGEYHTCALLGNDRVKCWGYNNYGNLGLGYTSTRGTSSSHMGDNLAYLDLGTDGNGDPLAVSAISAGAHHTCAMFESGGVKCWGRNNNGQLGYGDTSSRGDHANEMGDSLAYVDLGVGRTAQMITTGDRHSCAMLDNNQVKCWGYNHYGNLGLGDNNARGDAANEMGDDLPPVDLGTGRVARSVTGGQFSTCAILDTGDVKCWGYNSYGDLGLGDTSHRGDHGGELGDNLPTVDLGTDEAGDPLTAAVLSASIYNVCALLSDDTVKCWGRNNAGQLGQNDTANRGDHANELGDNLPPIDFGDGLSIDLYNGLSNGRPGIGCDDADRDGLCDGGDNCPLVPNVTQSDLDQDGQGDACDACPTDALNDVDGDGVCGDVDNCPVTNNPLQIDADLDGAGDACDLCAYDFYDDIDNDGICGDVDNCPTVINPDQVDDNGDGYGDACVSPTADIGDDVRIEGDVVLGPNAVIGDESIIQNGANVGGILGRKNFIGENAIVPEGCVLADLVYIGANTVLEAPCNIGELTRIEANSHVSSDAVIGARNAIGSGTTIHPRVQTSGGVIIGADSTIGADTVLGTNAAFGARANIGEDTTVESNVIVGDDVQTGTGVSLLANAVMGHRVTLADAVVVSTYARVSDDVSVGARSRLASGSVVGASSTIGADSEVRGAVGDSVQLGNNVFIGNQSSVGDLSTLDDGVTLGIFVQIDVQNHLRANVTVYDKVTIGPDGDLGANTLVLFFAEIGARAQVGAEGLIDEANVIGDDFTMGTNSRIWPRGQLGNNVTFGDGVLVRDHSNIGDDVTLEDGVIAYPYTTIGAQTTVRAGVGLGVAICATQRCGEVTLGGCLDIDSDVDVGVEMADACNP
ncbi:MAG: thrombospondin type 3 repeat-containing protein [Bradymonadia bacterium]